MRERRFVQYRGVDPGLEKPIGRRGSRRAGVTRVSRELLAQKPRCECGALAAVNVRHGSVGWKWFCASCLSERS